MKTMTMVTGASAGICPALAGAAVRPRGDRDRTPGAASGITGVDLVDFSIGATATGFAACS